MTNNYKEFASAAILIVLLLLLLNPARFWMPNALAMMMLLALVVIFAIFASFVLKENSRDEREALHKMRSGRFAFLAGAAVLLVGIVMQSLKHALDPWLAVALGVMLLAKLAGLIHSQNRY